MDARSCWDDAGDDPGLQRQPDVADIMPVRI
jgi:hypothetical protein